mgnify:CR=1 FL=1
MAKSIVLNKETSQIKKGKNDGNLLTTLSLDKISIKQNKKHRNLSKSPELLYLESIVHKSKVKPKLLESSYKTCLTSPDMLIMPNECHIQEQ